MAVVVCDLPPRCSIAGNGALPNGVLPNGALPEKIVVRCLTGSGKPLELDQTHDAGTICCGCNRSLCEGEAVRHKMWCRDRTGSAEDGESASAAGPPATDSYRRCRGTRSNAFY